MKFPRHVRYTALRILKEKKYFHWLVAGRMARSDYAFLPQDIHWLVRRTPVLLGWPGVAGIGLLTACAAFYFSTIQQAQVKLASTRYSVLAIQDELKQAGHSPNANHTPRNSSTNFTGCSLRTRICRNVWRKYLSLRKVMGSGWSRANTR